MCVAERDRERVRGVRHRRLAQPQDLTDHMRHLDLVRSAGADDGQLDRTWRVLEQRVAIEHGCECRTARLAELQRRIDIALHEHTLDRDFVRRVTQDQLTDGGVDAAQPIRQRCASHVDAALRDADRVRTDAVDDAKARATRTGIQAKHAITGRRYSRRARRGLADGACGRHADIRHVAVAVGDGLGAVGAPGSRGVSWHP